MRIEPVEKEQATGPARAVYEELEHRGGASSFFKMLGHKPEVLRTFLPFYRAVWAVGALAPRLEELAYLRASLFNGCAY